MILVEYLVSYTARMPIDWYLQLIYEQKDRYFSLPVWLLIIIIVFLFAVYLK